MQYPVIDLIAQAYINNGWTGLDISTGKNLLENTLTTRTVNNTLFLINEDKSITISGIPSALTRVIIKPGLVWDGNDTVIFSFGAMPSGTRVFIRRIYNNVTTYPTVSPSAIIPVDAQVYDLILEVTTNFDGNKITIYPQLERGTIATPYEPYNPNPSNDFPNRLKLPLPHYFPHPVIDALQRASAGTQTADDTEILQHYLTPLGIGGI